MASDLKVTQKRSVVAKPGTQRAVLRGMGLGDGKTNKSVILPDTPAVRGMIYKVPHLVDVERVPTGQRNGARVRARAQKIAE